MQTKPYLKRENKHFPMTLFITQQTEVLTFHHADEILEVLPLTLSMPECWVEFCKMTLAFESVEQGRNPMM